MGRLPQQWNDSIPDRRIKAERLCGRAACRLVARSGRRRAAAICHPGKSGYSAGGPELQYRPMSSTQARRYRWNGDSKPCEF
jgi:hypothetical protein